MRGLGASGWTLPYVLCRKQSFWPRTLVPYRNDEWLEYEDRLHPVIRGGTGWASNHYSAFVFALGNGSSATQTTVALDSNYVYNTSGDAIAGRISHCFRDSKTLNTAYVFITA